MAGDNASGVEYDVVVVGAGFAGMYLLHRLRELGMTALVVEAGDDVGGTWYWNRYPGARCDIQTVDYSYSFDPGLQESWTWSEKYATQPEILAYASHVADRHDLRRDMRFSTRVDRAAWDDDAERWRISTDAGDTVTARFYVMATGCLSAPKEIDIPGADDFAGEVYSTGRWPHDGVDFTGKRVAVIGTGSSGIQSIPLIAEQAAELTVFQRTPNFSIPADNGPIPAAKLDALRGREAEYRREARWSRGGVPVTLTEDLAASLPVEEQQRRLEEAWAAGDLMAILGVFADQVVNGDANEIVCEFLRGKIRSVVDDPATAEALCPTNHPFGTKRPCLDTNYYQTFNLPHVRLVDLRKDPIVTITANGIATATATFDLDAVVYATGFDAMTGAIVAVDITGRDGVSLRDHWADGPRTYLGLTVNGFPNFFTITGPGSPSVLSNMMVSIEQHVDWIADTLAAMTADGFEVIEPTPLAEQGWGRHVNDCADITLYPKANSWYMGANVPGKPRLFLPYVGGVDVYRATCDRVVEDDYLGFGLRGEGVERCNDGVVNRLQPDVAMVLEFLASLGAPPLESLPVPDARAFLEASAGANPPGPAVGEVVDGTFPGPAGELAYRLYRPATPGPHPVTVYYHGGGWVLGHESSDDPFCRDLCVRSDSIIVSCNYRHAPEDRFPAAADDAYAALCWVADHAGDLGGIPGRVAVAGWSAGGNLAAVVCQTSRDSGGPEVSGQVLLTPVGDADFTRPSMVDNAEGYFLTASLMRWFWDHYADEADRSDPKASPLLADSLAGLPPALVVTAEFDPLRDGGAAYAEAMAAAGVEVNHLAARGHIHTSITAVDVVLSGAPIRAAMAEALRRFLGAQVPA